MAEKLGAGAQDRACAGVAIVADVLCGASAAAQASGEKLAKIYRKQLA